MAKLLRDKEFFAAVKWNPHVKVVLDHRTGAVIQPATNEERRQRGLPPWSNERWEHEAELPSMP